METMDVRSYKPLEPILEEVNKLCVQMDQELKSRYRIIAISVVGKIIGLLTDTSPVFGSFYSRIDYVGSYYDGLRVKEATEFDLNIIIKLPLLYNKIKVENTDASAGYVEVNISEAKQYPRYVDPAKGVIEKWCNEHGYLKQNMVRFWFEGVISRALQNVDFIDGHEVKVRKSGPAFTLMIYTETTRLDVDLVLSLEFGADRRPPSSIKWISQLADSWVVVPKPLETAHNKELLWRISFPNSERKLTKQLHKLKYCNRFLKALRDALKMNIASYYIKTVFLWEAHEVYFGTVDKTFWEKNRGYLFVYSLEKLKVCLDNKRLPFYWHSKLNLFQTLAPDNLSNMANRLQNILKVIRSYLERNDVEGLRKFILELFKVEQLEKNFIEVSNEPIPVPRDEKSDGMCILS